MRLLSLALASLLAGCIGQGLDESQTGQNVVTTNYLSFFRLALNGLKATTLANAQLSASTAQASTNGIDLNPDTSDALNATDDGREVLAYIISCAMPADVTLIASDGTRYSGEIGLAASWLNHPMNDDQQRWVSACLFSRVNKFGDIVQVSLRGPHPQLQTVASEVADFTALEGAFYGQYFNVPQLEAYACSGPGNAEAVIDDRVCATDGGNGSTECGFTYTGPCLGTTNRQAGGSACAALTGGTYYASCVGQADAPTHIAGNHGASGVFSQVITSYVK